MRKVDKLVHLTVNGEEIVSTFDHPYYVKDKGFVSAEALWIGAELLDNNGNILHVEQIFREDLGEDRVKVYNFQVGEYHTYYVGNTGVLVHNAARYIEQNTVPTDKETVLSNKNKFSKIKRRFPEAKGASVYEGKDGNYYYRDTLHTGKSAHLEVFSKRGVHLGEADPLTGELIPGTADATKHLRVK